MVWTSHKSHLGAMALALNIWLPTLLVSALPLTYSDMMAAQLDGDEFEIALSPLNDIERLRVLLNEPSRVNVHNKLLNRLVDLPVQKRLYFYGLDNLDDIHRVMELKQHKMDNSGESRIGLRQLMERVG